MKEVLPYGADFALHPVSATRNMMEDPDAAKLEVGSTVTLAPMYSHAALMLHGAGIRPAIRPLPPIRERPLAARVEARQYAAAAWTAILVAAVTREVYGVSRPRALLAGAARSLILFAMSLPCMRYACGRAQPSRPLRHISKEGPGQVRYSAMGQAMEEGRAELERRVKEDPDAFGRLFELNYGRIFNYILMSTGDVEESLDLTSETFFKSLRALRRYDRRKGSFTAWLYAIASREIAMRHRRLGVIGRHVARRSFATEAGEVRESVPVEDIEDARNELERCEDYMVLAPLLRGLAPRYRVVLFLRFFEDRSLEEIAGLLGRPLGTVKAQSSRGLEALRKRMRPPEGPEHMEVREAEKATCVETGLEEAE